MLEETIVKLPDPPTIESCVARSALLDSINCNLYTKFLTLSSALEK